MHSQGLLAELAEPCDQVFVTVPECSCLAFIARVRVSAGTSSTRSGLSPVAKLMATPFPGGGCVLLVITSPAGGGASPALRMEVHHQPSVKSVHCQPDTNPHEPMDSTCGPRGWRPAYPDVHQQPSRKPRYAGRGGHQIYFQKTCQPTHPSRDLTCLFDRFRFIYRKDVGPQILVVLSWG